MMAWMLCAVALCASGVIGASSNAVDKLDIKTIQLRQKDVLDLFFYTQEPNFVKKCQDIVSTFNFENSIDQYSDVPAISQYASMIKKKWIIPRNIPFAVSHLKNHNETVIVSKILHSAKTYDAFFKTAVYLSKIINKDLFAYALSYAVLHRPDTKGLTIPPVYETLPNYFVSADVLFSAFKVNAQGKDLVSEYPDTFYLKDNAVIIKGDASLWVNGNSKLNDVSYFTHDHSFNAVYYYSNVVSRWNKDRRGEIWWYNLKQIVTRYYLERLSNGLGEIPALSNEIAEGYNPNLLYSNGVPMPSRPDNFRLDQNKFADKLEMAKEYERRIWEAIDKGFYISPSGEQVSIKKDEGADILGRLIHANEDSPNNEFYKDFFRLYTSIIGNTVYDSAELFNGFAPLVVPSAVENYLTALRDPAYYIVLKRILNLFSHYNKIMKLYTPEELSASGVQIEKVETDKLVTFMEETYLNLKYALPKNKAADNIDVSAQYTRLNHKAFNVKMTVKSPAAKTVIVKFFLAPKYDSQGNLISINQNTENFFQFDEFPYELKSGENVITRASASNAWTVKDWMSGAELYEKVTSGTWKPDASQFINRFPDNLLLPKGSVNGMTFQLAVFMDDYATPAPRNFDPANSEGLGSTARISSVKPLGYPVNRPLYPWQLMKVPNFYLQDVVIYHEA